MSYTKHVWESLEKITKTKLNNMENGIAANDTAVTEVADTASVLSELSGITSIRNSTYGASSITVDTPLIKTLKRDLRLAIMPVNLFRPYYDNGTGQDGSDQGTCLATASGVSVSYSETDGFYTFDGTASTATSWPRKGNSAAGANNADAKTFGTLLPAGTYKVGLADYSNFRYYLSVTNVANGYYIVPATVATAARSADYTITINENALIYLRIVTVNGTAYDSTPCKPFIYRTDNVPDDWAKSDYSNVVATNTTQSKTVEGLHALGCTWLSSDQLDSAGLGMANTSSSLTISAKSGDVVLPVYSDWIVPTKQYVDEQIAAAVANLST